MRAKRFRGVTQHHESYSVRWANKGDHLFISQIDSEHSVRWMSHEDLRRLLTHRDTLALVSESQDGEVVGFLVYSIHTHLYEIERLAVAKKYRRNGVGTALLNRLKDKASRMVDCESQTLRWRLATWLTEKQVTAQIFLKANGFRCTYQTHSVDGDSEERFVWSIQASS